jgi:hypothetical protein
MPISTHQSHLESLKTDAPSLLRNILRETGARYIQLLYDAVGDLKFRSSYFSSRDSFSEPELDEHLRRFAEAAVNENRSYNISAEELTGFTGGESSGEHFFTRFEFVPICSAVNRLGVLILGYDGKLAEISVSKKNSGELAALLCQKKQKLVESKEKIYQLSKVLITVQEPKLLGDVFKHQINPMLNLLTSAVICAKDGKAANEYRFYYNYSEFPGGEAPVLPGSPPHIVGVESFSYLYSKLRNSNESELFFELDFDRYEVKEDLHPFFQSLKKAGIRKAIIVNLIRGAETVGFWVMIFNKSYSINDIADGVLDAVAVQLATTVHSINTFSQLIDARKEGEVLQSLNVALASTRDERNLLKLIRTKLLNLFQFSHHFIYKINDDQMTVSMMLMDSHSRSQFHPSFETVMQMHVYIADGVFNKVLISVSR